MTIHWTDPYHGPYEEEDVPRCKYCKGEGWVCENHPRTKWDDGGCCGGAGMPCRCNKENPPWHFQRTDLDE